MQADFDRHLIESEQVAEAIERISIEPAATEALRKRVLETGANAVHVDPALIPRARQPIDRMLAFTAALRNGQPTGALLPHLGAA